MKKLLIVILGATLGLLAACAGEGPTPDNQSTVLESGQHGALEDVITEQYHNQADFQAGWDKLHANESSKSALPNVDFTKNTVVLFNLGQHKSGGYKARVLHAESAGAGFVLGFEVTIPGIGCHGTTQETTKPFIVVSIPTATDANIEEPVQKRQPDCTAK